MSTVLYSTREIIWNSWVISCRISVKVCKDDKGVDKIMFHFLYCTFDLHGKTSSMKSTVSTLA